MNAGHYLEITDCAVGIFNEYKKMNLQNAINRGVDIADVLETALSIIDKAILNEDLKQQYTSVVFGACKECLAGILMHSENATMTNFINYP